MTRTELLAAPAPYADTYVTTDQLMYRLHVSRRTVWRLVERGQLPQPIKWGRNLARWRWAAVVIHVTECHRRQEAKGVAASAVAV